MLYQYLSKYTKFKILIYFYIVDHFNHNRAELMCSRKTLNINYMVPTLYHLFFVRNIFTAKGPPIVNPPETIILLKYFGASIVV